MSANAFTLGYSSKDRATHISQLFSIDNYGDMSRCSVMQALSGSAQLEFLSKKALDRILEIDSSKKALSSIVDLYSKKDFKGSYNVFRRLGLNKLHLVSEHSLPTSVCYGLLKADKAKQNEKFIRHILDDCIYVLCGITSEEDDLLSKAHLKQKMPKSWNGNLDKDATFARYREVGIEVIKIKDL